MDILSNILVLAKILGLALLGTVSICLIVSLFAGVLEKFEGKK